LIRKAALAKKLGSPPAKRSRNKAYGTKEKSLISNLEETKNGELDT